MLIGLFCSFYYYNKVALSGIEPESGASETLVLSIVLQSHTLLNCKSKDKTNLFRKKHIYK